MKKVVYAANIAEGDVGKDESELPLVQKVRQIAEAELGNVHQTFNAFLNLDEEAELGDVGDDALHGAAHGIGGRHMAPGIFHELLDAEGELLVLLVNGEDLGLHHVAHMIELAGMADLLGPGNVGEWMRPSMPSSMPMNMPNSVMFLMTPSRWCLRGTFRPRVPTGSA